MGCGGSKQDSAATPSGSAAASGDKKSGSPANNLDDATAEKIPLVVDHTTDENADTTPKMNKGRAKTIEEQQNNAAPSSPETTTSARGVGATTTGGGAAGSKNNKTLLTSSPPPPNFYREVDTAAIRTVASPVGTSKPVYCSSPRAGGAGSKLQNSPSKTGADALIVTGKENLLEENWGSHIWDFQFLLPIVTPTSLFEWEANKNFGNVDEETRRIVATAQVNFGESLRLSNLSRNLADQVTTCRDKISRVPSLTTYIEPPKSTKSDAPAGSPRQLSPPRSILAPVMNSTSSDNRARSAAGNASNRRNSSGNKSPRGGNNSAVPPQSSPRTVRFATAGSEVVVNSTSRFLEPPLGLVDAVPQAVDRMNDTAREISRKSMAM
ncbi:unnamed protein product [Amoebophrya sp. A120]|nr:unnamed protein product [Amoebophrya sp. A120]|eukprot:GSA120T00006946001.1